MSGEEIIKKAIKYGEAINALEEIPALHRNAHVGHHCVDPLLVLLRQFEHPLDDFLIHIQLDHNAVSIAEYLIALLVQNICNGHQIGPLGNGCNHIAIIFKYRQPSTHAIRQRTDIIRIDFMAFSF